MFEHRVLDFLPDLALKPGRREGAWGEAGRTIEAGNHAPPPIDLPLRLAIVIALTLPLLSRLADSGVLMSLRSWLQQILVWP